MPVAVSYPGVYIEELRSDVRTITGVSTSLTAFVGRARRGPVLEPKRIQSPADFDRVFGGLWEESTMSYAVQQFFLNGGSDAIVVRVIDSGAEADITVAAGWVFEAAYPGDFGNQLEVKVDHKVKPGSDDKTFNLSIREKIPDQPGQFRSLETFLNVSADPLAPRNVAKILAEQSALVRVKTPAAARPNETTTPNIWVAATPAANANGGTITDAQIQAGLTRLEKVDIFNLLCVPPRDRTTDINEVTRNAAAALCTARRAFYIVDGPRAWDINADPITTAQDGVGNAQFMTRSKNAAVFFPRLKVRDNLLENRIEDFAPSGALAGIFARTDAQRGVWKAPAGTEATLIGASGLDVVMTDLENGRLNQVGVNCLRNFPIIGNVVWGSRTLDGADAQASEWKYIPVRRLALFIEESLFRGTQWVVFEPNDEPLWAQIRLNVGAFMNNLFRQGAFQGRTPREAYLVKCDKETTTQNDINLGIVNIVVGFAPLKPAEFVIIKIQQLAGQVTT
jgi:phage tail sheath protein FI